MKNIKRLVTFAGLLLGQSAMLTACGPQSPGTSSLDTVAIPQTPVEDQQYVGFCWAYASAGLIESRYKVATGKDVRLSPEALGFYRMVEGLYDMTRMKKALDILAELKGDDLQGWYIMNNNGQAYEDAMSLLKIYGVVPESVWSYKFLSESQIDNLVIALKANLAKLVLSHLVRGEDATKITRDEIISKVMAGPGAFPAAPPRRYPAPETGRAVADVDYMRNNLGFAPESYGIVQASNLAQLDPLIAGLKRSVVRGVDAILAFPVNMDRLHGNAFTGAGVDLTNSANFTRDGGHAVLITDFVNDGGRAGALPAAQVEIELKKSSSALKEIEIKNSWGEFQKKDAQGHVIYGSATGYYTMDTAYLQGSAEADPNLGGGVQILVPADIAADPFGAEPVNPKVASH